MDNSSAAVTTPLWADSWNDTTTVGRPVRSTEKHYRDYALYMIIPEMLRYVNPVILVFGLFGNTMTIVIMRRMKSGDATINLYFIALAASDLVYILVMPLLEFIRRMFGLRLYALHDVTCKLTEWTYMSCMVISGWFLVCMTVHRALSVVWPHRVNVLCTRQRVRLVIFGIVVFFALVYSHQLYGIYLSCNSGPGKCGCNLKATDKVYIYFMSNIFVYIDFAFYSVLPFIIMAVSNSVLIWKLGQSVKAAGKVLSQGDAEQVQAREKAAKSVSVTVIVVSLTFLLLTLPGSVTYIVVYFRVYYEHSISGYEAALSLFIGVLCNVLSDVNTAINFYLYCLTGRRFREEFIKIMCCGRNRRRRGAHQ